LSASCSLVEEIQPLEEAMSQQAPSRSKKDLENEEILRVLAVTIANKLTENGHVPISKDRINFCAKEEYTWGYCRKCNAQVKYYCRTGDFTGPGSHTTCAGELKAKSVSAPAVRRGRPRK